MNGNSTIVLDALWGDSAKGKIANWIAFNEDYDLCVRAGAGTNCGHSLNVDGKNIKTNQFPLAGIMETKNGKLPDLCVGPGVMVDLSKADREIDEYKLEGRVRIDYRCSLILQKHKDEEASGENYNESHTGSTKSGTGAARLDRVARTGQRICDFPNMSKYHLTDIPQYINEALDEHKKVIVEGAQGYYLSLYLSNEYPVVTSCNCTTMSCADDVGLPWNRINDVCMIIKSAPTRVSQACGDLPGEISKEEIMRLGIGERGVTTGRLRRKSLSIPFDLLKEPMMVNRPTSLALSFCDHVDQQFKEFKKSSNYIHIDLLKDFPNTYNNIIKLQDMFDVPVKYIEYGKEWNQILEVFL